MRITATMAVMVIAGAAPAFAAEVAQAPVQTVIICLDGRYTVVNSLEIRFAARAAAAQFAAAGIRTRWYMKGSCPAVSNGIRIRFSTEEPKIQDGDALAYALPYEGTHIVVFYDRVQRQAQSDSFGHCQVNQLLAYVLVHEITHILEGINRHSMDGIMKARWDDRDYYYMRRNKLVLAPADIELINLGLKHRDAHPGFVTVADQP
jgi:hypothetical protein